MRIKPLVLALFLFMATLLGVSPSVYAATDAEVTLSTKVEVASLSKPAKVSTTLTFKNLSGQPPPETLSIPAVGQALKSVSAKFKGSSSPIKASYDKTSGLVVMTSERALNKKNQTWTINLSYTSQLVSELGDSRLLIMPATALSSPQLSVKKETRRLELDLELGVALPLGGNNAELSLSLGEQIMTWQEGGAINHATGAAFGDVALADVTISTSLKNNSFWWKTLRVVLPPENNQQKIVLKSIDPTPTNIRLDSEGNILAEYRLAPFASRSITAVTQALINNYSYATNLAADQLSEEEAAQLSAYLTPVDGWTALELELMEDAEPLDVIKLAAQAARELSSSELDDKPAEIARERNQRFLGTLRASGVPARAIEGLLFQPNGTTAAHYWAEAYLGGLGWVSVDALNPTGASTADVRYVSLAIDNGKASASARPDDTEVSYLDGSALGIMEGEPTLSSTTYLIVPGLGLRVSKLNLPLGSITDSTALLFTDDRLNGLGSLAPAQEFISRDVLLGSKAMSTRQVSYGVITGDGTFAAITTITSDTSWLPAIVLAVVLLLGVTGLILYKRHIKSGSSKFSWRPKKKDTPTHGDIAAEQAEDEPIVVPPGPPTTDEPPASPQVEQDSTVEDPQNPTKLIQ